MKPTCVFILFLLLFAYTIQSYGQCPGDCTGQYYYKDSDAYPTIRQKQKPFCKQ